MILHAERRLAVERDAAIGAVEERDVRLAHASGQGLAIDGEAMVHRHDLYLAAPQIFYRMIGAVMTLRHLSRLRTEREREHLMAQANPEQRHALGKHARDRGNG